MNVETDSLIDQNMVSVLWRIKVLRLVALYEIGNL